MPNMYHHLSSFNLQSFLPSLSLIGFKQLESEKYLFHLLYQYCKSIVKIITYILITLFLTRRSIHSSDFLGINNTLTSTSTNLSAWNLICSMALSVGGTTNITWSHSGWINFKMINMSGQISYFYRLELCMFLYTWRESVVGH